MPSAKLASLRKDLEQLGVDAILVSMKSSFDNYDSDFSDIRTMSNFSGSNGRAIISKTQAILAVDGRYTTQASHQTDSNVWEIDLYPAATVLSMVKKALHAGETIAISSMAHSFKSFQSLCNQIAGEGYKVKVMSDHPVVKYRPSVEQKNEIIITETDYIQQRIDIVTSKLKENEALLLANKETISWIFGTRKKFLGSDQGPVANAIAFLPKSGKPIMFSDLPIQDNDFFEHYFLDQFGEVLSGYRDWKIKASYSSVPAYFIISLQENGFSIEPTKNNYAVFEHLKSPTEIEAQREGALRSSEAFIKTLAYVDHYVRNGEKISEKTARSLFECEEAIAWAFPPICAAGENTAVVHYVPETGDNAILHKDSLFLFDAGFHFPNSTTDMTRTVYLGDNPPEELRRVYTIILNAFIQYSLCKFPDGTYACSLDAICRHPMWQHGMDYEFGTGHGVGNFRSVHEAPHIGRTSSDKISANMITTVEPGFYTDTYGIRLENMLLSVYDDKTGMVAFETLTFIPFCRALIDENLLDVHAKNWLNQYHSTVAKLFTPIFKNDPVVLAWMEGNTRPLPC